MKHADAQPTTVRAFGRGSPVLDYWLGRCMGFELVSTDGSHLGVVERVMVDHAGRARAIAVRTTILGRRRWLDPRAVEAVVPEQETIAARIRSSSRSRRGRRRARLAPAFAKGRKTASATAAWARPRSRAAVELGIRSLVATGSRFRRRAPVLLAGAGRAAVAGARRARPYIAALARLVRTGLLNLGALVLVVARETALRVKAYRVLLGQKAARRAATRRRAA
jgi:hypothetical protein